MSITFNSGPKNRFYVVEYESGKLNSSLTGGPLLVILSEHDEPADALRSYLENTRKDRFVGIMKQMRISIATNDGGSDLSRDAVYDRIEVTEEYRKGE
jgi:hypothetical protein